jgi:methyl-accepting chemotaxis protein PixJ
MIRKINTNQNSTARNSSIQGNTFNVLPIKESNIPSGRDFQNAQTSNHDVISRIRRASLRTKAITFAFAMGTLPVLLVGALNYYLVNQSTIKEITHFKQEKARLLADNINHFMLRQYGAIQLISKLTFLQNRNLKEAINREPIQTRLSNYLDIEDGDKSIAVFDLNGELISESKGQSIPNQKDQEYFQAVLKTNKPSISQPLKTPSIEKAEIYFTAPVKDTQTGQALYIIRISMPVKSLVKAIQISQISQDNYDLIDAYGQIFLSSKGSFLGKDARQKIPEWQRLQAQNQVTTSIVDSKEDNTEELVTYVPTQTLAGLPDLGWKLVLSTPTTTALATHKQLFLALQIGTLITAFLVSGIAVIIVNRLLKPIMAVTTTVKKLGQGNLDTRIAIEGEDEFAILGSNINHMADQLQDLLQKQTAEADKLRLLTNILLLIRSSLNSEDLFKITVTQARQALKADRVVIYKFNSHTGGQIIAESVAPGLPVAFGNVITDACIDQETIEAYRNGRILVTNNVLEAEFAPEHLRLMEQLQIKANLVTPILKDNQVFGFLIAHHCFSTYVWQPYEINFLRQLAVQVGLTLERIGLLEATQLLKNFAIRLSGILNSQDISNLAVHEIRQALKAERVIIYKFNENWYGKIIAESVATGWPKAFGAQINDPCFVNYVEKYQQGRIVAINNIYQAGLSRCYMQQLEPFAVKANLVAPILLGDELLGLLIAHQCSQPRAWLQSEIDLFEQMARIVGLALERADLLEQTEKERKAAEVASQQQRQQKETLQLQLLQLIDDIEGAARGDLTVHTEVTDGEIGTIADFFNSIVENLREIVTSVKLVATQVDEAIAENSGAISQLATKALQQADRINHTLDSVDQMRISIQEVANSASLAAEVAHTASRTAEEGGLAMDLTVENIISLRETIGETTKKVKRLGESSQQISQVVALINQIAMQTNLLAINTGIEAARAGQDGHGFAVIAEEVAVLAAQSTEATSEIEAIVSNIQLETSLVVKAMELGTAQVVEGTRLVQDTKQSLNDILSVCRKIDELVHSISQATISQVQTSQEVTDLMQEVAKVSEMTSTASRQVSSSLQKTEDISRKLQASVSTFKID